MILQIVFRHLNPGEVIETVVFTLIGILVFGFAIWVMQKVTPFSIRKEIEEDQNVALAVVISSSCP